MSHAPAPTKTMPTHDQLRSIIHRLDVILAELDRAHLALPALDVASAILKLQQHSHQTPTGARYSLRSTA